MRKLILLFISCCFTYMGCKERKPTSKAPDTIDTAMTTQKENAEIEIIPVSHATAVLLWKDITIYIDPVGGADAFKAHKQPDLILITDIHGDHLSVETLLDLNTEKAKIMVPQAVADKMPPEFTPQIDVLNNGDSKERFGIKVEAIPMYNLREEALKFHEKGRGNGYVLNIAGERLYFSGDSEDIPEMRALKDIDKAFVCMNLPYTMTVESAADAVLQFKPKQIYPYHYRGRPEVSDVVKFKALVNEGNPDIEVVQLDWYPADPY
ncbi:MBL fold metallo-hydrolase [Spongiimicrobium sp. 3-5]|uniref:MBL fold metallo-hydrolase n=1 Tax=Spongiimicrobium sp. 3-5 TaxID=3332596 RepID=UPI00397F990C